MSRTSRNEECKTNVGSAFHDQESSKNVGGQEIGGVSQPFELNWPKSFITDTSKVVRMSGMNDATHTNSREESRVAGKASRMPVKPSSPPTQNAGRRVSTYPRSDTQVVLSREGVPKAPTTSLAHPHQVVTCTPQERGYLGASAGIFVPDSPSNSRYEPRPEKHQEPYDDDSNLKRENNALRRQIRDLKDECQGRKEMEKKLTGKIDELKRENEMRESEILQAQIRSFRNMKQGRWLPQEENSLQRKLELLQNDIKQWAKSNAMKSIEEVNLMLKQTPVEQDVLVKGLGKVVRLVNGVLPPQILGLKLPPSLCLNAMLANEIYMRILADPFFFLEDDIGLIIDSLPTDCSIPKQSPSSNVLYGKMYDDLITVDAREAHVWRSQMLRILSASTDDDAPPSIKKIKNHTEECRQKVCSRHAKSFLEGPGRHLLQITKSDATSDRAQRLEKIFQMAGTLSCQFWTQRTYFKCRGLPELTHEPFSIDSPIMELHPLIHLDETPARLDGHPIAMVVNPLVEVEGTDEAENYDQTRVLAKAVVWLPLES